MSRSMLYSMLDSIRSGWPEADEPLPPTEYADVTQGWLRAGSLAQAETSGKLNALR